MNKLIATAGEYTVRQTGAYSFEVIHATRGREQVFRTEARALDLLEMLTEAGR